MSSQNNFSRGATVENPTPELERQVGRKKYPLSLNQQHMWFQAQLDLESSLWNLGAKMNIFGPLNVPMFVQALQHTVDRHEILRTVFAISDDVPVQQVLDDVKVSCPVQDLPPGLSNDARENAAWTRLSELSDPVYDLSTGPLFRTGLLRASETEYYFVFGFHHLLLDAFYSGQFMKEIITAYDLLRCGHPLPGDPAFQFGDFCVWQDEKWSRGFMADSMRFWKEQLQEPLPEIQLPSDPSVPFPRLVRSQVSVRLNADIVKKLHELGRQARTTLFRVMLAAFTLFFSRLSETGELILDIDFSTRPREMGHTIGFFANLLPVRLQVLGKESFIELLRAVDSKLRDVSANREFPVRQLTRKLKGRRHATQPLSPIVVTQLGILDWALGDLRLTGSIYVTASIHDLWLGVLERDDDLEIVLAYPEQLFSRSQAREWASWVEKTVHDVIEQPDIPVSELISLKKDLPYVPWDDEDPGAASRMDEVIVQKNQLPTT